MPPDVPKNEGSRAVPAHFSRRVLLRRGLLLGTGLPVVGGLLAACGSSSSSSGSSQSTASSSTASTGAAATSTTTATSTSATSQAAAASPSASGSAQTSQSASPAASASSTSKYVIEPPKHTGGKLIWGAVSDAKTVNPVVVTDTSSGTIMAMIFNGVMQTDVNTTEPIGDLATKWEISTDGVTYSFTLRDGVKFHDGVPLTANDVKFTYELMLNPKTQSPRTAQLTDRIKSIDVVDDTHITYTLKKPVAPFLATNMETGVVPQHILKDVQPSAIVQDSFSTGKKGRTIGSGPWIFEEWVKDDHITLNKNPNYFGGAPHLDQWIYKVVSNASVEVQQLKTGEIDYGGIQPSDYNDMQKQSNITMHVYDTFSFTYYMYQLDATKTPLFQDKAVRQALLYAIDRQAIVKTIYFGLAEVAIGTMPLISWAYNPNAITNKYPYDPNKAKQLLDQAGWKAGSDGIRAKDGKKLSFKLWTYSGSDTVQSMATVFQQEWKQIGVDSTPQFQEWNSFLTRIENTHDFDIALLGFSWGVDPDQSTMWACASYSGGFNMNKYCNPQVDKLLSDALATTDKSKRKQYYTQMQNILEDDLPNVVVLFSKAVGGVNKRVHNFFPNAVNTQFNSEQWWVDG